MKRRKSASTRDRLTIVDGGRLGAFATTGDLCEPWEGRSREAKLAELGFLARVDWCEEPPPEPTAEDLELEAIYAAEDAADLARGVENVVLPHHEGEPTGMYVLTDEGFAAWSRYCGMTVEEGLRYCARVAAGEEPWRDPKPRADVLTMQGEQS